MITQEQAWVADIFHYGDCVRSVGPRGGVTEKTMVWRRNGLTKRWKREPGKFRIPIKHGLKQYGSIDNYDFCNAEKFHAAEDCPLK